MLVYDLTNENTFESIRNWIKTIKEVCLYLFTCVYMTPKGKSIYFRK